MFKKRYFYSYSLHRTPEGDPGSSMETAVQQGYGILTSTDSPVKVMEYIKETKGLPGHYLHLHTLNRV